MLPTKVNTFDTMLPIKIYLDEVNTLDVMIGVM